MTHGTLSTEPKATYSRKPRRLAVIGAAVVDIVSQPKPGTGSAGLRTTVPGTTEMRLGGVARNVHEAAFRIGCQDATLIAPVGRTTDPLATVLEAGLVALGANLDGLVRMSGVTPSVNMILDDHGTLEHGVAATQLVEELDWKQVKEKLETVRPEIVCFDGNISVETMRHIVEYCGENRITSVFEPTSDVKACKLLPILDHRLVKDPQAGPFLTHMAPNRQELEALCTANNNRKIGHQIHIEANNVPPHVPAWLRDPKLLEAAFDGLSIAHYIWLKAGSDGLCLFKRAATTHSSAKTWHCGLLEGRVPVEATYFAPLQVSVAEMKNSIGAGDSLLGGILAGLSHGLQMGTSGDEEKLAHLGQLAAIASLHAETAVGNLADCLEYLQRTQ